MAEFVEFRAERWVEELEQMERLRLFAPEEIKTIARKRRDHEYKIQRRTKCKEDFLKYIQYEIDLYRIVKARRKKTGIKTNKAELDFRQTHRIANLFKQAVFRFQSDVKLWMSFFKFCEGVKFHSLVSQMLVRMLQIHSNKPDLWVFAAKWEFGQCKSIRNARQFLTKGLRHHPTSEKLYQELFRLELDHIKLKEKQIKLKKKKDKKWYPNEVINNIVEGKVVEVVYKSAVKTIPDIAFKVSLLKIAKQKRRNGIIIQILQDMLRYHFNDELTWDAIAKREFEGFSYNWNELLNEDDKPVDVITEQEKKPLRESIQSSISIYEEAVQKLNTPKMWSLYLDHVLKLNENTENLPVYKAKVLENAMEGAVASGNMPEQYYLHWIDFQQKQGNKYKKLSEVLKSGTEQHPKSLALWYSRLRFHLTRDQREEGMMIFKEAVANLTDAVPIWKLMVRYLLLKKSDRTEEVLKEGITRGGEVAQVLKPLYVEWLAQTKGMPEARRVFRSPEMNLPPCLELCRKMAALESSQTPPSKDNVRKCHEMACSSFGKHDPSVWLEYIKFELNEGDKIRVAQVHRRALKSLDAKQVDEFVAEYNNFKLGVIV